MKSTPYWFVVEIFDGDTFDVRDCNGRSMRVRLWGMDAPEKGQIGFKGSRDKLTELLSVDPVSISLVESDRYGRMVCKVRNGAGQDVSLEMVRSGWAHWYRQYCPRELRLALAQAEAQKHFRGIWRQRKPVSPWGWRRGNR